MNCLCVCKTLLKITLVRFSYRQLRIVGEIVLLSYLFIVWFLLDFTIFNERRLKNSLLHFCVRRIFRRRRGFAHFIFSSFFISIWIRFNCWSATIFISLNQTISAKLLSLYNTSCILVSLRTRTKIQVVLNVVFRCCLNTCWFWLWNLSGCCITLVFIHLNIFLLKIANYIALNNIAWPIRDRLRLRLNSLIALSILNCLCISHVFLNQSTQIRVWTNIPLIWPNFSLLIKIIYLDDRNLWFNLYLQWIRNRSFFCFFLLYKVLIFCAFFRISGVDQKNN